MIDDFDASARTAQSNLRTLGLSLSQEDRLASIEESMVTVHDYLRSIANRNPLAKRGELATAGFGIRPELRAAYVRQNMRDRRQGRESSGGSAPSPKVNEHEVPEVEPHSIMSVSPTGMFISNAGGPHPAVEDFMGKHGHSNKTLRSDIDTILSHIARIDFGSGKYSGVKKLSAVLHVEGKDLTLYEFKPSEAKGCSTKTKLAKALRVFFIIVDETTVGLVDVVDRRDAMQRHDTIARTASATR